MIEKFENLLNIFGKNESVTLNILLLVTCFGSGAVSILVFNAYLFQELEILNLIILIITMGLILNVYTIMITFAILFKYLNYKEIGYFSITFTWINVIVLSVWQIYDGFHPVSFETILVVLLVPCALSVLTVLIKKFLDIKNRCKTCKYKTEVEENKGSTP